MGMGGRGRERKGERVGKRGGGRLGYLSRGPRHPSYATVTAPDNTRWAKKRGHRPTGGSIGPGGYNRVY